MNLKDKLKQAIQGIGMKFGQAVNKSREINKTLNTPIDRSNQAPIQRAIGSLGEKGFFGPLPQVVTAMTKIAPKTILPTSHFFAGIDPTGLSENFATEGQMLPDKQKYTPYRVAGGATAGLITGGPKMLLKQTGIGAGLGGLVKIGTNIYNKRPVLEDVDKSTLEGGSYGAQTSATFNLVNGIVGSLGAKIPFMRALSDTSISQGLPTAKMTVGMALGKLGRTGLKRIIKAALVETPIEGMIYGFKERGEKEKLLASIENQMVQNLIFNVGFAGVNTLWDSKVLAPIVTKSISQTMDQINKKYPQLMAENLPIGLTTKPVGGQQAVTDAQTNSDLHAKSVEAENKYRTWLGNRPDAQAEVMRFMDKFNTVTDPAFKQKMADDFKIELDTKYSKIYSAEAFPKGEANLGGGKVIPTVKVREFNIEEPVAKAVSATFDEGTASSGFHRNLDKVSKATPSWAIVYTKKVSPELVKAAEDAGLKVNTRPNGITDVYLPSVLRGDSKTAQKIFDKFAENYQSTRVEQPAVKTTTVSKVETKPLDIEAERARLVAENRDLLNAKPVGETINSYLERSPELKKKMSENRMALSELGMRQRGVLKTIQNSENTTPEVRESVAGLPQFYAQQAQKPVWDDAVRQVAEDSDRVKDRLINTNERSSAERTALYLALAQKYYKEGNIAEGTEIIKLGAEEATMTGQSSAAWALWSKMTPEGMIKWAEKQFDVAGDKQSFAGKLIQNVANRVGIKTKATGSQAREISYSISKKMNEINNEVVDQIAKETEQGKFDFFNKVFDVGVASTNRIVTAAGSLSRRLQNAITSKEPKDKPIKDMIDTLFASAKELLPKETKIPRSPFDLIKLALKNKGQYQSVFELAQKRIGDKYKNKPKELAILKPFLDKIFIEPFSKAQGEKVMGLKMKELGIDMTKLIKEHYSVVEATKQDLLLKLQLETGLDKKELKPLADFVEKRFAELTQAKKQAYLDKLFAEKKIKVPGEVTGKKGLTQQLIELSNTGALRDQKYNDLLAEKLGLPTMTPELAGKIYQKMSALQTETDPLKRRQIITDVFDDINKSSPPGLSEIIDVMRYNGMLSGWKPQMRNIYGNFFNIAGLRTAIRLGEVFNDWMGATLRGTERQRYLKEIPEYYRGFINAFPDAITAMTEGWKGIARSEDPELRSLRNRQFSWKITFGGRALEAMDRFFTILGAESESAALQARGMGKEEAMAQAQNTAEQYIYRNKLDPKNITGQGDFLAGYDKILGGLEKFTHDFPAIKWVIPFMRIGGMVMKESLQYAPGVSNLTKLGATGEKASQQAAKSLLGYGVMAMGMTLAMQGRTTWAIPTDETKRKLFYDSGRIPYAVKIGNRWIPMTYFGPLIFALGVPAAFNYYNSEDPKAMTKEGIDKLSYVLMNTMKGQMRLFSAQSFLSSFENLIKIVSGDEDTDLLKFGINLAMPAINPYQGFMRSIAQLVDPVFRKAKGPVDTILKDIPFLSTTVPAYENSLGGDSARLVGNSALPYDVGVPNSEFEVPYQMKISQLQSNAEKTDIETRATKFLEDMKGGDPVEAQKQIDNMQKNDPLLYKEVLKQFSKRSNTKTNTTTPGVATPADLYKTKSGQEPGRAKYIVTQLKDMDEQQSAVFLNEMYSKGVITPKVQLEIQKIMLNPRTPQTYGTSIFEKIRGALSVPNVGAADGTPGGLKVSDGATVQGAGIGYPTGSTTNTKSIIYQYNAKTKKFEDPYGNLGPIQDTGKTEPYTYTFVKKGNTYVDEFGKALSLSITPATAIKSKATSGSVTSISKSMRTKIAKAKGVAPKKLRYKSASLPKLKLKKQRAIKNIKLSTSYVPKRIPNIRKIKIKFPKFSTTSLKV